MKRAVVIICALVTVLSVAPVQSSAQSANSFALQQFKQQVASYMALRQGVVDRIGVPGVSSNSTNIVQMQNALADGIRQARPHAAAGDFFSREVSAEFRRRIDRALELRGVATSGLAIDLQREAPATFCTPSVNGNFDWRFGAMMPTAVIEVLPDLPWPLQYRFICRGLVLLDVDAGLIVDVLPDALTTQ